MVELRKGSSMRKDEFKEHMRKFRFNRKNSVAITSILQQAGYVKMEGSKRVRIKKDLFL